MFEYQYERPALTTDMVVFRKLPTHHQVLTIERGGDPYKGFDALPGGFANPNERLIDCAIRELEEETSIVLRKSQVRPIGEFDTPGRDPRGWVVSFAYCVFVPADVKVEAKDDAKSYKWRDLSDIFTKRNLAFDHYEIVRAAYKFIELGSY